MAAKVWAVFSKYGQEICRFETKMQADAYAKNIDGATVHHVG